MPSKLSAQEFVNKWQGIELKERSASQEHFLDLCRLIGHPTPVEADSTGESFCFEAGATKMRGGQGWADVWKRGYFAWEYKGKHKDLDKAYQQLQQYRDSLMSPPLLIVSDMDRIVIHTNFTNTVKRVVPIQLDDLLTPEGRQTLRDAFTRPEAFRAEQTTEQVTQEAAREFARLADLLRQYGADPQEAAHFLIRMLFCLFAEDVGLLPKDLFTQLVQHTLTQPAALAAQLRQLFQAMATGGWFGIQQIRHFDGKLFDSDHVFELDSAAIRSLAKVCTLDWSTIEPSIFGTLFERSLDPSKRSQLGAHYTSRGDILLIVEPVLMVPLRRRWEEVKKEALELARLRDEAKTTRTRNNRERELMTLLTGFAQEIAQVQVLDAACGSANFLYIALKLLLDLWKEVSVLAGDLGLSQMMPLSRVSPSPEQLYGIELNPYAHELAQATIWIGYIQWLNENGYGVPDEPILKPLDNILRMDAILAYNEDRRPVEPEWPEADVIIGNPPFLGGKRMRTEMGDHYVDSLFLLYEGRVSHEADLVCYWFERARALVEAGKLQRAGLLATQGIRGGANRQVLARIKETGDIFWAQSDRDWILDGATVHVSMVGFDGGDETERSLDGQTVDRINSDLSSQVDLPSARRLRENEGLSFMGVTPAGPFYVPGVLAREWLAAMPNPNGRPNSDVVRPYYNGTDLNRRLRNVWIVDFGVDMSLQEAAFYELPFEYIRANVYPIRAKNNRAAYREKWWLLAEARSGMRAALAPLSRYIGTSMVAKHRFFCWVPSNVLPANLIIVVAREDDLFFGMVHSRPHELWARGKGTQLREAESGSRYTPTTTFETFPFPWPPGQEPTDGPLVQAIAEAARELVEQRARWLNPDGASGKELKKRTLTNLYNQRPTWLELAHRRLDEAVLDAYGWPHDLSDEEILERLLALNLERAGERNVTDLPK